MRSVTFAFSLVSLVTILVSAASANGYDSEDEALRLLDQKWREYEDDLLQLAAIPSISALPEHQADVLRASQWLIERLTRAGLENAAAMETGAQPVVYADWLHAGPDAPTVLFYAHYDVQPADPLELWNTPPFEPILDREAGIFRGRGVSDDKQGVVTVIHALEVLMQAGQGRLPVNVKLLLEGQEEIGSPDFEAFMEREVKTFACDYAINADGLQIGEDQPGILLGMRGMAALEVEVRTVNKDLHSGTFGGSVQNPNHALAELLASLHTADGAVAVEGFYEGVSLPSEDDKKDIAMFPFNEAEEAAGLGLVEAHGEAGFSTLERRWLRPTLEVVGMWGGFTGEGLKTVLPAVAHAKISCRLVPGQIPDQVAAKVEAHIQRHKPPGTKITTRRLNKGAHSFVASRSSPAAKVAAEVLERVMGKAALLFKAGGSIPALAILQRHLGVEPVSFGFTLDTDALHSPNELFRLTMYEKAHRAFVHLLVALAKQPGKTAKGASLERDEL